MTSKNPNSKQIHYQRLRETLNTITLENNELKEKLEKEKKKYQQMYQLNKSQIKAFCVKVAQLVEMPDNQLNDHGDAQFLLNTTLKIIEDGIYKKLLYLETPTDNVKFREKFGLPNLQNHS